MCEDNKVSVLCLAYNHENYIAQCLDGFVRQKTDFKYEVIVHDDASTDRTAEIIRDYVLRFPHIIKPVYETENQYAKGRMKYIYSNVLYPMVSGKYIAYCEGDDYWTDDGKLQKQVDVLEGNPDCHICMHTTRLITNDGRDMDQTFPQKEMKTGVLSPRRFMQGLADGYFFHTSSFLVRTEIIRELTQEMPDFYKTADLDDMPLLLYFGAKGNAYYIAREMSCYRRNSIGSWTSTERTDINKTIKHKECFIKMYEQYDTYTQGNFHDLCEHWANNERFMIAEIKHDFKEMVKPQYAEWLRNRSFRFVVKVYLASFLAHRD